jgi:hypothetical protein
MIYSYVLLGGSVVAAFFFFYVPKSWKGASVIVSTGFFFAFMVITFKEVSTSDINEMHSSTCFSEEHNTSKLLKTILEDSEVSSIEHQTYMREYNSCSLFNSMRKRDSTREKAIERLKKTQG